MSTIFHRYIEGETPKIEEESPQETIFHKISKNEEFNQQEPSFGQHLLGIPRIAARGGGRLLTSPMKNVGLLLSGLSKIGTEGRPGTELIRKGGEFLTGGAEEAYQTLQNLLEPVLGKPTSELEQGLGRASERYGDILGTLFSLGGSGAAEVIPAALAGQGVAELGGGPIPQTIAELAAFSGRGALEGLAKKPVKTSTGLNVPKVASKEVEKFRGIKPKVFKGRKAEINKQLAQDADKLVQDIKKSSIPVAEEVERGVDVAARNEKLFDRVNALAKKNPLKMEPDEISNYLNKVENNIKKVPVATEEQEKILKLVDKYKDKFKTEAGRAYKTTEYVDQFRNINRDIKKLYQQRFIHGEQQDTMKFYEGLKDSIENVFENKAPSEFTRAFKAANKEFSQLQRLDQFEEIMKNISDNGLLNPKKLNTYLKTQKRINYLKNAIGKDGYQRLKNISQDVSRIQNKLDLVKTMDLGELVNSTGTIALLKYLKIPAAAGAKIAQKSLELARGRLLTSPQVYRDTSKFLNAIRQGNKKGIATTLIKLDQTMQKEDSSRHKD